MHDTMSQPFNIIPNKNPASASAREEAHKVASFGQVFTDHMVIINWNESEGWHNPRVVDYQPISLDPASAVFHYGQTIFEGLKAYRNKAGEISLFRPNANAERFAQSAQRMAMAELPTSLFVQAVKELVKIDHQWVPNGPNASLYIRPFMIASEAQLGVNPSKEYIFCVIASPVQSYFKHGQKPVRVWIEKDYSRAGPGGTGSAKCGGNYAASMLAQAKAKKNDCEQVLFLDVVENKWIEELGGMNVCFVMDDNTLITPPLDGTILPGITRNSVITLAQQLGLKVLEQSYSMDELRADVKSGKLREVFACGTAAVIAAISAFRDDEGEIIIGDGQIGEVTAQLYRELTGLQTGEISDTNGWVEPVAIAP